MACIQSHVQCSITALTGAVSTLLAFADTVPALAASNIAASNINHDSRSCIFAFPCIHTCSMLAQVPRGDFCYPHRDSKQDSKKECEGRHSKAAPSAEPLLPAVEPAGHLAALQGSVSGQTNGSLGPSPACMPQQSPQTALPASSLTTVCAVLLDR